MKLKKERLEIEIKLLEWIFSKTQTVNMKEQYFYAFSQGVLDEKKLKLKECDEK